MGYAGEYNQAMNQKRRKRVMAKSKRYPLGAFMKEFSNEAKCREYLANLR